ncbi:hypothetical protein Scep_025749 [Stephania cephalantha]|uniref:Uncharacterized protein n=1 Tax=Stephania cephalantha TaxID=152367 RepID=A0AAP0ELB7_9MAGN
MAVIWSIGHDAGGAGDSGETLGSKEIHIPRQGEMTRVESLRDVVEEGKRFSNEENDPMTSKELKEEPYEVEISCTVL